MRESISIVIPAYNEARRIRQTLLNITRFLNGEGIDYEIIVVDDGSNDGTDAVIREAAPRSARIITNEKNYGKGFSVKRGVLAAEKAWILMTDADLSTPIEELRNFFALPDFDVVIGSRDLKGSKILVRQPLIRELGGRIINAIVRSKLLPGIKDTQCGFKLFRHDAAQKIFSKQTINDFSFDIEILYIAKLLGYRVKEIPITWKNNPQTKVHPWRDGLSIIKNLAIIKENGRKGLYK